MIIKKIKSGTEFYKIFDSVKDRSYPFLLDSCANYKKLGRFSFIGFDPLAVFKSKNKKIEIIEKKSRRKFEDGDAINVFQKFFDKYASKGQISPFPFSGGFVGFLSYDLARRIEKIPRVSKDAEKLPDIVFGLYDGIFIYDHRKEETYAAAYGLDRPAGRIIEQLTRIAEKTSGKNSKDVLGCGAVTKKKLKSDLTKSEYFKNIAAIKKHIKNGDIFQVNFSRRFETEYGDDPWFLYRKLREINPAPFSCFFDFGNFQIISSSPERFVKVANGEIETRPIKGTAARGADRTEDVRNRKKLLKSGKDRAELVMIVDVSRNDLGRICEIGTVKVKKLVSLEKYPTVYHLVAAVAGKLKKNVKFADIVKAAFPGASVTGAPKIRAMEIIDAAEMTRRNIYTGSIGYLDLNGNMDFNIAIRTMIVKNGRLFFRTGGAIVWDSDKNSEYRETVLKGEALRKAAEF